MELQAILNKKTYKFNVTPINESGQLYFLIDVDSQLVLAQHVDHRKWTHTNPGKLSKALIGAIMEKIEKTSASAFLGKLVRISATKVAA